MRFSENGSLLASSLCLHECAVADTFIETARSFVVRAVSFFSGALLRGKLCV